MKRDRDFAKTDGPKVARKEKRKKEKKKERRRNDRLADYEYDLRRSRENAAPHLSYFFIRCTRREKEKWKKNAEGMQLCHYIAVRLFFRSTRIINCTNSFIVSCSHAS